MPITTVDDLIKRWNLIIEREQDRIAIAKTLEVENFLLAGGNPSQLVQPPEERDPPEDEVVMSPDPQTGLH